MSSIPSPTNKRQVQGQNYALQLFHFPTSDREMERLYEHLLTYESDGQETVPEA